MADIQLTQPLIEKLVNLVNIKYPNWQGFSDSRYIEDELSYKESAVESAQLWLKKDELQELLSTQQFDGFQERIEKVAYSGKNLLYLAVPTAGDLKVLYDEALDQGSFFKAFYDLLYAESSSAERLDNFSKYLETHNLPNKWAFTTYFLYLINPETDMFVKPTTKSWFLRFCGAEKSLPSKPNGRDYQLILDLSHQLMEDLRQFNPTSFIDIQSFLWVAKQAETKSATANTLGENFEELFGNFDDALFAFRFLETAATFLEIKSPMDPLIAASFFKSGNDIKLHLSYGNWLVVGFDGKNEKVDEVLISLFKNRIDIPYRISDDFSVSEEEPQVSLYRLSFKDFKENEAELLVEFKVTMEHVRKRFAHWKASPYHNVNNSKLAEAILDETTRDEVLFEGIPFGTMEHETPTRYWKIAPGREAWNWGSWKEENIIAIGWDQVGDLSGKSKDEIDEVYDETMKKFPDWGPGGKTQLTRFMEIQIGDQIIANKGKSEILGYGTVIGDYYFVPGIRHGHRIPVKWDNLERKVINEGGWAMTILELSKKKYDQLLSIKPKEGLFTQKTFDLLAGLHEDPTAQFYSENKDAFKEFVETPFQNLMRSVVDKLNPEIIDFMETGKGIFSRFLKNDYGRGGAWDYYWGRFYPKGINKSDGPQLILSINREVMFAGFINGDYSFDLKKVYAENIITNKNRIIELLGDIFSTNLISIGNSYLFSGSVQDVKPDTPSTIDAWIADPNIADYDLTKVFLKESLIHLSLEELSDEIAKIYNRLYPFVLLAYSDNPIPKIEKYLGITTSLKKQPVYTLEECSEETGFNLLDLTKFERAIDRKKQAIFYGPPGTGKTYLAEKIAKHLIGGGFGFSELIQFHPEVAYEDFIQGIRPEENTNGELRYPLVPGRFLDFCEKANQTDDICVLIIDEINRANLSRVFGELMYLLEYREKAIYLAAGRRFNIPSNVRIIGTMNTADRSIALVDHALRRRFAFLSLYPDYELLRKYHQRTESGFNPENLIKILHRLNKQIGDRHYFVGPSYFLREDIQDHLKDIWQMEIEPYLEEFFFDQPDNYKKFTWETIETEIGQ